MPLSIQERFADAAEGLEGVPFVERGRDPKVGLDCVGLILVPARAVGVHFEDRPYVTVPGSDFWTPMVAVIESQAERVDLASEWRRGDVLGSRFGAMRNHLGIFLGGGWLLHASDATAVRKVVKVPMDPSHRRMVKAVWRLR